MYPEGSGAGGTPAPGGTPPAGTPPPGGTPPTDGAGAGAAPATWYAPHNLDKDVVEHIEGKKFPDLATALRQGMDADKIARARNVLEKPDPKNLKEWKHWNELGWEADAAKYALAKPKDGSLKFEYNGELWDRFRKAAHEARVPVAAAQAIHDDILKYFSEEMTKTEAKGARDMQVTEETLRTDWGTDFDAKREIARRTAQTFGIAAEDAGELERVIGAPRLLKMFAAIGEKIGEDSLVTGKGQGVIMTPSAAAAERRRLEGDKEWMAVFKDRRHPQNADYAAQRQRLIDIEAGVRPR